jgi:hypothetical protein
MLAVAFGFVAGSAVAQTGRGGAGQSGTAASSRPPAAPAGKVEFRCPAAGTVVTTKSSTAVTEWTSQGADPSDPTLCIRKQGATTTERYFGLVGRNTAGSRVAELKKGMGDIIAGSQTEFSFRYDVNQGTERWSFVDTWTRVGSETLTIGGRNVETIILEQTQQNLTRPFKGTARFWLDRSSGIWMKRVVVSAEPKYPWGEQFEVSRISAP